MAQLNSRGTMTRGRWDFFESSDGFAFVYGSVPSGGIGAYFVNNSTGAAALDIYNITWQASLSTIWELAFMLPPFTQVPLTPTESFIHPLAPSNAAPPGVVGMFTAVTGTFWTVKRYSSGQTSDSLAPIAGSYFVTLPPGWGISISAGAPTTPCELSMTVWYQEVIDNIAPAR